MHFNSSYDGSDRKTCWKLFTTFCILKGLALVVFIFLLPFVVFIRRKKAQYDCGCNQIQGEETSWEKVFKLTLMENIWFLTRHRGKELMFILFLLVLLIFVFSILFFPHFPIFHHHHDPKFSCSRNMSNLHSQLYFVHCNKGHKTNRPSQNGQILWVIFRLPFVPFTFLRPNLYLFRLLDNQTVSLLRNNFRSIHI